jgi:DNA-binding transcriptional ArsR family regulator
VALSKPDAVFDALGDSTRRGILDLLQGGDVMTAGDIASAFSGISRPAVSRHLRVLRDSGLVVATESGREWHYRIETAPLRDLQAGWLSGFAPMWDTSLRKLKQRAESDKNERRVRKRETPAPSRHSRQTSSR